jgi:hypothetical protein
VGTTVWLLLTVANPLATTALIEGLNAATTYEYQIRVKCSNDPVEFSPYSSLLTFTTSPFRLEYGSEVKACTYWPLSVKEKKNIIDL